MRFRLRPLAAALGLASITLLTSPAQADINATIGGMFDGMVSTSPAGRWETQSRGVISGGGVRVRTPIVQEQLFNVQMPSADASCGGIDLFGGSFSYVNSDQLTQLGRQIIANARNMAFKMGLEVVSPKIAGLMQEIENTVRSMNELSINSCEWAQGLMAPGARAIENRFDVDLGLTGQEGQVFDSFFDSFARLGGGSNAEDNVRSSGTTSDAYEQMVGNIFWKAMQRNNIGNWNWVGNAGSNEIMEMVQSFVGTIIVGERAGASDQRSNTPVPAQASLQTIVLGGEDAPYLRCNNYNDCSSPSVARADIRGMEQRIRDTLLGAGTNPGLIDYYSDLHSDTLSIPGDMRDFMSSLPFEFGARIAKLAAIDEAKARYLVENFSELLALEASVSLLRAQIRAARTVISTIDSPYQSELLALVSDAERRLSDERQQVQADQNLQAMEASYRMMLESANIPRHFIANPLQSRASGAQ